MAIEKGYLAIASILVSNGAKCTKEEIEHLGKRYTDFISSNHSREASTVSCHIDNQTNNLLPEAEVLVAPPPQQTVQPPPQQTKQHNDSDPKEVEALRLEIQNLKKTVEKKNATIQRMKTAIQQKDTIIQQMQKRFQQQDKQMLRDKDLQIQLWEFKRDLAQKIESLKDLRLVSKIGTGCDAVVFNCSAEHLGIPSVALKILFNLGINTSRVRSSFANEYEILRSLPCHINIIPIWKDFQDRPSQEFINLFPPQLKEFVVNEVRGNARSTTCIVMPILESFDVFFKREFRKLTVSHKFAFISDIISGLLFLFSHHVVHRDMKLNNLLINSAGRIIITDFGCSTRLLPDGTVYMAQAESVGGNVVRMAPEIRKINTNLLEKAILVDYSKQPCFELGMLAFEIFFADIPESCTFGEHMDNDYFTKFWVDDAHNIPEFFDWLRGLLMSDPHQRTTLAESATRFHHIQTNF